MYAEDTIKQAESLDIIDYCLQNSIEVIKDTERYYRLVDHDSCVIDRKRNGFYWNSRGVGGNIINFIQELEGLTFRETMEKLTDEERSINYEPIKKNTKNTQKVNFIIKPFVYLKEKEVSCFERARKYLVEERKIDPDIVDQLHQEGLIKQDKYNNVLFIWKDNEKIIGCSEQGTVRSNKLKHGFWKGIQKDSTPDHGFNVLIGEPKNLKFFEAPIDLLSYMTLKKDRLKNTHLISMDGLKHNVVFNYVLKAKKRLKGDIKNISLCVDNDKAGLNFINKVMKLQIKKNDEENYIFTIEIPISQQKWDWNDELKHYTKERT